MFKTASEVLAYIKEHDVKFVDVRFTDLPGVQQHFNLPVSQIDEDFFANGQLFDASSIRVSLLSTKVTCSSSQM